MAKKWFDLEDIINNKDKMYYFIDPFRKDKKARLLVLSYEQFTKQIKEAKI